MYTSLCTATTEDIRPNSCAENEVPEDSANVTRKSPENPPLSIRVIMSPLPEMMKSRQNPRGSKLIQLVRATRPFIRFPLFMHSWCGLASPDHAWRCSHTQDTHSPLYTHRPRENHSAQGAWGSTSNQTPHTQTSQCSLANGQDVLESWHTTAAEACGSGPLNSVSNAPTSGMVGSTAS